MFQKKNLKKWESVRFFYLFRNDEKTAFEVLPVLCSLETRPHMDPFGKLFLIPQMWEPQQTTNLESSNPYSVQFWDMSIDFVHCFWPFVFQRSVFRVRQKPDVSIAEHRLRSRDWFWDPGT